MKILKWTKSQKEGFLMGHADMSIATPWGVLDIYNIACYCKNGNRWIKFPSKSTGQKDDRGYFIYAPQVDIPERDQKDVFQMAFFPLLDAFVAKNAGPSVHTHQDEKSYPWNVRNEVPF